MTLATLALYRGLAEGISQARSVRGYPEWFFVLGQGEFLGVPTQLWILLVAIIVFGRAARPHHLRPHALRHRRTTRRRRASRAPGRPRQAHHLHAVGPACRASPPVVFVSRVTTTRSDMGIGIELDVIAAVVLGGTSIFGGSRHHRGHRHRPRPDPAAQERPGADRRQGRRHNRRHRDGAHRYRS